MDTKEIRRSVDCQIFFQAANFHMCKLVFTMTASPSRKFPDAPSSLQSFKYMVPSLKIGKLYHLHLDNTVPKQYIKYTKMPWILVWGTQIQTACLEGFWWGHDVRNMEP